MALGEHVCVCNLGVCIYTCTCTSANEDMEEIGGKPPGRAAFGAGQRGGEPQRLLRWARRAVLFPPWAALEAESSSA